jgi:hypothetical protein
MALKEDPLTEAFEKLFNSMAVGSGMTNHDYAAALSKAITEQIKTAEIPAGAVVVKVTGDAAGVPNPDGIKVV